jgi:predicted transcriptional regulator
MELNFAEQLKVIMDRQKIKQSILYEKLDITRQSFSKKLKNNDFTINDMKEIAKTLDCVLEGPTLIPMKNANEGK